MPRLPISPQKPRHENATTPEIPVAQTSESTEFSGNITAASEDVRLRGWEYLWKYVAWRLALDDLRLVGEKKQGTAREEEEEEGEGESTISGDDKMWEKLLVYIFSANPNEQPFLSNTISTALNKRYWLVVSYSSSTQKFGRLLISLKGVNCLLFCFLLEECIWGNLTIFTVFFWTCD